MKNASVGSSRKQVSAVVNNGSPQTQISLPRSPSGRREHSMNTIESSVTKLLVATKKLLDSLTAWSKRNATEKDVSDVYVVLGNEFNVACRAFTQIGVETTDLGNVPGELRVVLEKTLSQEASQSTLDQYLPEIRQIVVKLLQGLRRKQSGIKAAGGRLSYSRSNEISQEDLAKMPRSVSSTSTSTTYTGPVISPSPEAGIIASNSNTTRASVTGPPSNLKATRQRTLSPPYNTYSGVPSAPPNMALPKMPSLNRNDALAVLQRGEALERRASRRYSAYQISKMTAPPPLIRSISKNEAGDAPHIFARPNGSPLRPSEQNHSSFAPPSPEVGSSEQQIPEDIASIPESSHHQGMTKILFLQLGRTVRKIIYEGEVTTAAIRLLFIEKFSYSPGSEDFPQLYLQDPASGVRFLLEDMSDVQNYSVISLNIDTLDEVKKHVAEGLEALATRIDSFAASLGSNFNDQNVSLNKVLEQQSGLSSKVGELFQRSSPIAKPSSLTRLPERHLDEITSLRTEIATLRQVHNEFKKRMSQMVTEILTRSSEDKAALSVGSSRGYMEAGKTKVGNENEVLLGQVDDLQDTIEALRKDVAQRGIRPLPRQLESVKKDLAKARHDLDNMVNYMKSERPLWKKFWERELDNVCEEQQFFNMQEELLRDLFDDLGKAAQTFNLVEECSAQQNKGKGSARGFVPDSGPPSKDAVLSEVRSLQPDHKSRVEAIKRAEKARQKALEERLDAFENELGDFVGDSKLKKSGGVQETERLCGLKDEQLRRQSHEIMNEVEGADGEEEETHERTPVQQTATFSTLSPGQEDPIDGGLHGGDIRLLANDTGNDQRDGDGVDDDEAVRSHHTSVNINNEAMNSTESFQDAKEEATSDEREEAGERRSGSPTSNRDEMSM